METPANGNPSPQAGQTAAGPAWETLAVEIANRVATVWLDRPTVRNAFNEISIAEIAAVFAALDADPAVRAIVLAGRGPAFCAGGDLNWMKKMAGYGEAENRADARGMADMLRAIDLCSKPVVARVHGDCYAGGVGLAAACDIVVAADVATFCLSETRIGLIPATISPYVIRAMGVNPARRYFLTAEPFSAGQAQAMGFVTEVAGVDELDAVVARITKALSQASPDAVVASKRLVRDVAGRVVDDDLIADTVERIAAIRASPQGREGVSAFLEKRKPGWLA
jgi:methylglutaconyl-CoA hydratase